MIILSEDFCFRTGIKTILDKNKTCTTAFDIIFDASNNFIYFFKMHGYIPDKDVLTYFLHCERYRIDRNSTIKEIHHLLNVKTDVLSENRKLTKTETLVIRQFLKERNTTKVAQMFSCSKKTISGHKMRALRKLGFRNMPMFIQSFNLWCHLLNPHKKIDDNL